MERRFTVVAAAGLTALGLALPSAQAACPLYEGALVKTPDAPEVYIIHKGRKWHVADEDVFAALGKSFAEVCELSDEELAGISDGYAPVGADGSILHCPACGTAVYQLAEGEKRAYVTDTVYLECVGLTWDDTFSLATQALLDLYPEGALITGATVADCDPGASESTDCDPCGSRTRTCANTCTWAAWSECPTAAECGGDPDAGGEPDASGAEMETPQGAEMETRQGAELDEPPVAEPDSDVGPSSRRSLTVVPASDTSGGCTAAPSASLPQGLLIILLALGALIQRRRARRPVRSR